MSYICIKSVKLSGTTYQPGDVIPADAILSNRVGALISSGLIVESDSVEAADSSTIGVPIVTDNDGSTEVYELQLTESEVQKAFLVLQMTADEAKEKIADIDSQTLLLAIEAVDSRTSVQKAASKQALKHSNTQDGNNES